MEAHSVVIAYLHSPKERFWGIVLVLNQTGLTLRGVDLATFDDWTRQVASGEEPAIGLTTMFFPMARIEKLILDESSGSAMSFSDQFLARVGRSVKEYLEL
ncbi:MAG: hypothetical protein AB1714_05535 [Acidobacteriota bacterium]